MIEHFYIVCRDQALTVGFYIDFYRLGLALAILAETLALFPSHLLQHPLAYALSDWRCVCQYVLL
jgi:hypothetical protein